MSMTGVFLRRARIRGLKEGRVQTARIEALENDVKDAVERWQDYGFACNAVEGQGLVINAGGHTIVLRMDRIAERPQLAAYEVSVWHKEGHNVTLRNGKVVEANCDIYRVNAAVKVELNTPVVAMSAKATVGDTLAVTNGITGGGTATLAGRLTAGGVTAAGKVLDGHTHPDLTSGGNTGPNN